MDQNEINVPETCDKCPFYIDDIGGCRYVEMYDDCYYAVVDDLKD